MVDKPVRTAVPTPLVIHRLGAEPAVAFAATELARYLKRMTGAAVRITTAKAVGTGPGIWLGTFAALGLRADRTADAFDDHVRVRAGHGSVVLAGVNPRSVLFAVYRWLEELGCRWLRPGSDGERVPTVRQPLAKVVELDERPSYRHRCICIEGSCSREHVLDMIDYAAKRGFNAYFLQFRTSFTFFNRWYSVEKNQGATRTAFGVKQASVIYREVMDAALERGLGLHMVGHGWTCEPFGISGLEWRATDQKIPPAVKKYFAEVKGKRELWGGIPLNTQLCYSQPKVRSLMAQAVVEYAAANRDVDIIHVWLADGANNFCECAACRGHRPSDLYVKILNEIDARLTAKKLPTRIVFLAYVDLLWAPQKVKVANPDRFILMFAPITRSYSYPFIAKAQGKAEKPMAFKLNQLKFPASPRANLALFAGWVRAFPAGRDRVDFDYHLWRDWCHDPGQMQISPVIHADACALARLGMHGYISCQAQRVSYPTGLPMHLLGSGLWNRKATFAALAAAYFKDCFGAAGPAVQHYLAAVTRLFDPAFRRGEKKSDRDKAAQLRHLAQVPALVTKFQPRVAQLCRSADPVTAAGGRILRHHAWYITELAKLHALILRGDPAATAAYDAFAGELERRLPEVAHVLDTWMAKGLIQHAMHQAKIPFTERIVPA